MLPPGQRGLVSRRGLDVLNARRNGLGTWFRYMHATMRERQISVDVDIGRIETTGPNRNPFIDNPEWVACMFMDECDAACPQDLDGDGAEDL